MNAPVPFEILLVAALGAAHAAVAALDSDRAAIARRDIDAGPTWANTDADTGARNDHAGTATAAAR